MYVKAKEGHSIDSIMQLAGISYQFVNPVKPLSNTFHIQIESGDIFVACQRLYETGSVIYAEPSFYYLQYVDEPESDNEQNSPKSTNNWNLKGIENISMGINAINAWNIATGAGIKIAILDDGVLNTHPALVSNTLSGYSTNFNLSSSTDNGIPGFIDISGTRAAGIIASTRDLEIFSKWVFRFCSLINKPKSAGISGLGYSIVTSPA